MNVFIITKEDWYSGGYERDEAQILACTSTMELAIKLIEGLDPLVDSHAGGGTVDNEAVFTVTDGDDCGTTYRIHFRKLIET